MPKDPTTLQEYLSLQTAAQEHPGGGVHKNTMRRWADRGYSGIVLKTKRIVGRRMTTREWLAEFYEATSRANDPNPCKAIKPRQQHVQSTAHVAATAKLEAAGI